MDSNDYKPGSGDNYKKHKNNDFIQCEEGPGVVAYLLTLGRLQTKLLVYIFSILILIVRNIIAIDILI